MSDNNDDGGGNMNESLSDFTKSFIEEHNKEKIKRAEAAKALNNLFSDQLEKIKKNEENLFWGESLSKEEKKKTNELCYKPHGLPHRIACFHTISGKVEQFWR